MERTRAALAAEAALARSHRIAGHVLDWEVYRSAAAVVLYAPLGREVSTEAIRLDAHRAGRSVFFPRMVPGGDTMTLVRVHESSRFVRGALGVSEPEGPEATAPDALAHGLIIVPGVAFSLDGGRLGRGGGHYDRFLAGLPHSAVTAGLSYGFQLLDQVPRSAHDQRLDFIVTEFAIHPAGVEAPTPARNTADQGGTPRWT
jgi:5-formyltetrahydrofolate cyclo-ligase